MKLKALLLTSLAAFVLTACDEKTDYSGVYKQAGNNFTITVEKGKNNDYQVTYKGTVATNTVTGFVKNAVLYNSNNNQKLGEFKENSYINGSNHETYTKQ
ncbi:hypothetical protein [Aggregatibacter kilianii]|uniref:hypothetical protein n=1 Tax=Aggregatibacter kilianii TaxID=2025884 RepID=UPI000D692C41|nr:hypothetical protein [Aggregatibacter kilianii]